MSGRFGHGKTTTFVAASGTTATRALRIDSPMTGELSSPNVEQFLAPTLSAGDVVVIDNLPANK